MIAVVAFVDWIAVPNLSFGFLYLFPVILTAHRRGLLPAAAVGVGCSVLKEGLGPAPLDSAAIIRGLTSFFSFIGAAVVVVELARSRRIAEEESRRREVAEAEARVLIESSPAAIVVADEQGSVLRANETACEVFACQPEEIAGQPLGRYLPVFREMSSGGRLSRVFRLMVESTGHRHAGECFLAHSWFSGYKCASGVRIVAMVVDASEELRDREQTYLRSLRRSSDVIMGAISHEIRNLCGAVCTVHSALSREPLFANEPRFRALRRLVDGLRKVASVELEPLADPAPATVDLKQVLSELRIIIQPEFSEAAIDLQWDVGVGRPRAQGRHGELLQVFLNLAQNARRALEGRPDGRLIISAYELSGRVIVRFLDNGPGVEDPERLFKPLHGGDASTGLGLFVSRSITRSFGGDIWHARHANGTALTVELASVRAMAHAG